jgi:hypothetical protein
MKGTPICDCGGEKSPAYETCYQCARKDMALTHDKCVCGRMKKKEFNTCYNCKPLPRKEYN